MKNKVLLVLLCLFSSKTCFNSSLVRFDNDRIVASLHYLASIQQKQESSASAISDLTKEAINALEHKLQNIEYKCRLNQALGTDNHHSEQKLVGEITDLINTWKLVDIAAISIKEKQDKNLVLPPSLVMNFMPRSSKPVQKIEMLLRPSTSTANSNVNHFVVTYVDQNGELPVSKKSAFTVIHTNQPRPTAIRILPSSSIGATALENPAPTKKTIQHPPIGTAQTFTRKTYNPFTCESCTDLV